MTALSNHEYGFERREACGPMARTRKERISTTVLGQPQNHIVCPLKRSVGLLFERDEDPLDVIDAVLAACGLGSPEQARRAFQDDLPTAALVAAPTRERLTLRASSSDARMVLREAIILGLCTPFLYDPARPVLWTRASLSRRLDLFDMGGFYAAN